MALFFNRDDLTARLNNTACWAHETATSLAKHLKYEGRMDNCKLSNLSLVIAYLEVMECYTPIAATTDDFNCMTEAQAEQIFDNISKITGLCFIPKNTDYLVVEGDDNNQFSSPIDAGGKVVLDSSSVAVYSSFLEIEGTRI